MTSWKIYILCAAILPLAETKNDQRGYKLETTTTSNQQELLECEEMSEEHKIKVGNRIEPVIFELQWKIKLSRSIYKVTSYVDFKPYKQSLRQFGQYIGKFLIDLHDPNYISTLYNADKPWGEPPINRGAGARQHFTEATCWQATYRCRIKNQFIQLFPWLSFLNILLASRQAMKINQIYMETYKKFLRAIDHMEFHPTLGRAKTRSTIRFKRQPKNKDKTIRASQYTNQMKSLTKDDKLMLKQAEQLIETKFLNKTTKRQEIKGLDWQDG